MWPPGTDPELKGDINVGLIGCGAVGRLFGTRLLRAGRALTVHDREREAARPLLDAGAAWANTPAELASNVTVTVSCLPSAREIESAIAGPDGLLAHAAPHTLHIETSTVGRVCLETLARLAEPAGIRLIDAAVSRGSQRKDEATEPEIVLWVGAAADHFDLARPVLELLADRVVYCGGVGLGQTTKVVNNLIAHTLVVLVGEALALGLGAGASLDVLATALQHGTGQSRVLDDLFPVSLFQGDFRPGLRLDLALKDLDLAQELAGEQGLELAAYGPVRDLFEQARARGWGDRGAHSVVRLIEERAGVELRSLLARSGKTSDLP